jgi:Fic-DOC domain mobile mystery protein B
MELTAWHDPEDGNTPLDEDESEGLIPEHITKRAELNEWEAENIRAAIAWAAVRTPDMLKEGTLRALHKRMFEKTWSWAGTYRTSNKSIGPYPWQEVPRLIRDLLENTKTQYAAAKHSPDAIDELAARFHHQLVLIHPWPNGNGRHAREATDLLLRRWGRPPFSWGASSRRTDNQELRQDYLRALRAADAGNVEPLMRFVRT